MAKVFALGSPPRAYVNTYEKRQLEEAINTMLGAPDKAVVDALAAHSDLCDVDLMDKELTRKAAQERIGAILERLDDALETLQKPFDIATLVYELEVRGFVLGKVRG